MNDEALGSRSPIPIESVIDSGANTFLDRGKKVHDKVEFVRVIAKHKITLFGDGDGIAQSSLKEREDAWRNIAQNVQHLGSYKGKSWQRLRDHDWQYVRRHAVTRTNDVNRGSGVMGTLDSLVMNLIGDSNTADRRLSDFTAQFTHSMASYLSSRSCGDHVDEPSTSHCHLTLSSLLPSMKSETCDDNPYAIQNHEQSTLPLPIVNGSENIFSLLSKLSSSPPISRQDCLRSHEANDAVDGSGDYSLSDSPSCSTSAEINDCSRKRKLSRADQQQDDDRWRRMEIRKLELETANLELQKIKLEKELLLMEEGEKRAKELHSIELRKAKLGLARLESIIINHPTDE